MSEDRAAKKPQRDGYEVGYGKPPKHTRFKPGQRGNPRGRPRRSQNERALDLNLLTVLNEPITVRSDGKRRKMPAIEFAFRATLRKALEGDHKALQAVFRIIREHKLTVAQRGGVLVVPGSMSVEEWMERAEEEQAPYRGNVGDPEPENDK